MAFKYYEQIKSQELPSMEVDNVQAFLKDFSVSEDTEKPITSGLFRLQSGESLKYTYTYHWKSFFIIGNISFSMNSKNLPIVLLFISPFEHEVNRK